jgi:virginiamycin A acetyltransferase
MKLNNDLKYWIYCRVVKIRNANRIKLKGKNKISIFQKIQCRKLVLSEGARINGEASFRGTGEVHIGKWAAIGQGLKVLTSNHIATKRNMNVWLQNKIGSTNIHGDPKIVVIGAAVWIGDNVTIIRANIGDGAIIGAGSVVTRDVPPFAVVAGNPARVLKYRFDQECINKLLQEKWWNWTFAKIKDNASLFNNDL